MTSTYDARGRRVGATVVEIQPNIILGTKSKDGKDGYNAILLGYGSKKSVKKPQMGVIKKAGVTIPLRWFREVKTTETTQKPGDQILLSQVFSKGDNVKVTGVSKGRGFTGGVKRYNFAGGPKTHGQSDRHRAPGSIGAGTTPGRVYKGKKMAGHMGVDTVTVRNLEVVSVDKQNNLLTVKGAVPGFFGGLVTVTKLGRIKGYTPPPEEKEEEPGEDLSQPSESVNQNTDKLERRPSDLAATSVPTENQEVKDAS